MTDYRRQVRQAKDIYQRRHTFDEQQLEQAIVKLAEHKDAEGAGLWSMAQVAAITGAKKPQVYKHMKKTDHTGGRFNPGSLDLVLEEIANVDRNEPNRALTAKILVDGTSSYMLAKLTGQKVSTIKWRAAEHRKTLGAAA